MATLSPRYPSPQVLDLPEDIRAKILEVQEKSGFIPNVFLALARRPAEWRAFFAYHAALMLREGLHTTTPTTERPSAPDVLQLDVTERESARPPARVATPSVLRLSVGLEGRAGFGPTPGLSVAPGIVGALSLEAFVAVVRLVYWPSSDALGDGSRPLGALVRAFVGTLEAGARVGEDVGVSVTGVVEGGASISRGLGIVEARDVTSGVLDVGLAATMDGRVGLVTWFFRVDVLAALVRPTYLVGDYLAFEAPPLRGSLSVGALVSPGP